MHIIFIASGSYAGFKDAVALAMARAQVPISVVSDCRVANAPWTDIRTLDSYKQNVSRFSDNVVRWFVLNELSAYSTSFFPVLCLDWDVLVFRPVNSSYKHMLEYDVATSTVDGAMSAAYGVNSAMPLSAFTQTCNEIATENPSAVKAMGDMEAWIRTVARHSLSVGNLAIPHGGSVWDHNIHSLEQYAPDGDVKRIVWQNADPYFVFSPSGDLIAANTIHCWGTFKTRTAELRKLANA